MLPTHTPEQLFSILNMRSAIEDRAAEDRTALAKIRDAAEAFHDKWPLRVKGYNCRLESKLELIGTGETPVGLAMFQGWRRGDASSMGRGGKAG